MSIAKSCDICGKLYPIYNTKKSENDTNGIMLLNIDEQMKYYSHKPLDCCPECMDSIKKRIKMLKEGGKYVSNNSL